MKDLTSPFWIKCKGGFFLVSGLLAGAELLFEHPSLLDTMLLVICVWSFCRCYYFAFYVIERYVDPSYRFSGLGSFLKYWWRGK